MNFSDHLIDYISSNLDSVFNYKTDLTISVEEEDKDITTNVYQCILEFENNSNLKILGVKFSEDDYYFLVKLENTPTYCIANNLGDRKILIKLDGWTLAPMEMMLSLAAGLEQLKSIYQLWKLYQEPELYQELIQVINET